MKFGGEVPIRLDKKRSLKFTFKAYRKFQSVAGQSVNGFFLSVGEAATRLAGGESKALNVKTLIGMSEALSTEKIAIMLWAALLHESPNLTLEEIDGIMDYALGETYDEKVQSIFEKLTEAYFLSKGQDYEEAKKQAGKESSPEETASSVTLNGNQSSG